jgi:glycosyltransferase involved in cell wall biosynthesis
MVRVLMVAYSCDPESDSEDQVGWQLASRISRRHPVHLITRPKGREAIERSITGDGSLALTVEYHEMWGLRRLKSLGLPVSNLRYLAWNHRLADRVSGLAGEFAVVHHTTWVRNWMPSAAAGSASTPFVWGPVGAAERTPPGLARTLSAREMAFEGVRAIGPVVIGVDSLMRRTLDRVAVAVASSPDTALWMDARGIDVRTAPSVGYDPAMILPPVGQADGGFISIGRLLGWKGFHLALAAFARLDDRSSVYQIIGDGPSGSRLRQLARHLGIADRVEFLGHLPSDAVLRTLGRSRVLVHPSFHDSGGFAVVEAIASGVPAVTLDVGGPPFLAGEGGLAIDPSPPSTLIERLAAAMETASETRSNLSARALERAKSLTWESIVDVYDGIYSELTGSVV